MSGGSMDYLSYKVEEASFTESSPLRRAFRKHLKKVAKALHEIEWADSCDTQLHNEHEVAAILDCIQVSDLLDQAVLEAHEAQKTLADTLALAKAQTT